LEALSGVIDSVKVKKKNENSVFRITGYSPTSYAISIASNAKFRITSVSQYLIDYERWQEHSFNIEYKMLEKNRFLVIAKIKIQGETSGQDVIARLSPETDKNLRKYLRCRIVKLPVETGVLETQTFDEGVYYNKDTVAYPDKDYLHFVHQAGERYLVNPP
jgi:hypothetical protein